MSQELVLTGINTTFTFCSVRSDFEGWLKDAGASETTIRSYVAAIEKWLKVLALSPEVRPAVIWQRSQLSASIKRVVGYACRRYAMFAAEVLGQRVDLGIPSRLPVASRPNPKPISDKHLRELSIAAKKIFPKETSISFRVWLQFLNETGCRRSESEIDWSSIDWLRRSVIVRGKTGEREILPQEIGSLDRVSVANTECWSTILPIQKSCREDRSPGSPASSDASSTTDKTLQLSARNQSSACAFFCRSIESIKSSILLPCFARGKEAPPHGEVSSG
jgi:hypothetical protein